MIAIQILVFLGALAFAAFNVISSFKRDKNGDVTGFNIPRAVGSAIVALLIVIGVLPSFGTVSTGHRGVLLQFNKATGAIVEEGLYFTVPFVQSVAIMNVQVQAHKMKASAASRDLQIVATEVTTNYHLDPHAVVKVYQELRDDYVERVMDPATQEAVKAATAKFDAERLIVERAQVKQLIEEYQQAILKPYGIIVDGVAITNFAFSPDFEKAIEDKVTSQQLALKAQNDLQIVKFEAQQTVAKAQAQAEAIKIQAQAVNAQGGRDYVTLQAIEAWKSGGAKMPTVMVGGKEGGNVLMMIPGLADAGR